MNNSNETSHDSVRDLENLSIHNFDENFWLKKSLILKDLLDNEEKRKKLLGEEDKTGFLLFELYSTKIHCCETLLRILIVTKKNYFRPLVPLIQLSFKKFHNELDKMQENLEEYLEDSDKFFKDNFYPFSNLEKDKVDQSIKFLKGAIPKIISEYSDRGAYNVFKHGFYGSVSKDTSLSIEGKTPIGKASNMITWYEIEPYHDHHKLLQKNKAISTQRESNVIKICTSILSQLFLIKRAQLNKSTNAQISFFNDIDLNKIFSIYSYDNTTMSKFDFTHEITLPEEFP